jgi:outer membrane murein-binding lipoprotein Lpp
VIILQIDQNIVSNYLNSRPSDQQLKCGQMLATIKWLMEKQEQLENEIKQIRSDKNGSRSE